VKTLFEFTTVTYSGGEIVLNINNGGVITKSSRYSLNIENIPTPEE